MEMSKALRPPPILKVSEWADLERRLSPEASAEPGRWYTSRAVYLRGIMDAVNDPSARIYQTTERQTFHTDSCDMVALLCLKTAKSGGESALVSSMTIYNEMYEQRPDLLELLFQPFVTDRRGEVPVGKKPYL